MRLALIILVNIVGSILYTIIFNELPTSGYWFGYLIGLLASSISLMGGD